MFPSLSLTITWGGKVEYAFWHVPVEQSAGGGGGGGGGSAGCSGTTSRARATSLHRITGSPTGRHSGGHSLRCSEPCPSGLPWKTCQKKVPWSSFTTFPSLSLTITSGWKVAYVEAHVPDEQSAGGGGGGGLGGGGGMQWNVGSWRITPDSQ